ELIDQSADSKGCKCHDILLVKEDFSDVERQLGFFIRLGHFLDVADDRSIRDTDMLVLILTVERIEHFFRHLLKFFVSVFIRKFFYNDDILLINRRNKILRFPAKKTSHVLKRSIVLFVRCLNNKDNTFYLCVNM